MISVYVKNKNKAVVGYRAVEIGQLASVPDGSQDAVVLNDTTDYVDNPTELILQCSKKVKYGGELIISALDVDELIREYTKGSISHDMLSSLLYGEKQSISSLNSLLKLDLPEFKITKKNLEQCKFLLIFRRKNVNPDIV